MHFLSCPRGESFVTSRTINLAEYKSVSLAVAWSKSIKLKNSGRLNLYFCVAVILTFFGSNLTVPEVVDRVTEIPEVHLI